MDMNRILLAVDPGKMSGVAAFKFSGGEPELLYSGEYAMPEYHVPILRAITDARVLGITLEVVCERFTINAQTVKNSQAPYSLEQIGILKYLMLSNGIDHSLLVLQSPADAKRMFPNEALKKLDYWHRGGEGHALDAIRHGLLRLAKTGWTPMRLLQG
jgi:hypothetical protein